MNVLNHPEFIRIRAVIWDILHRKHFTIVGISLLYIVIVGFLKWFISPPIGALFFVLGGLLGIYFLDLAESFFRLSPSPFRSMLFVGLFVPVSFFVVTSSGSLLATGLVLSLYFQLVLWQIGEMRVRGNIDSWYKLIATPVSLSVQRILLVGFCGFFLFLTYIFI